MNKTEAVLHNLLSDLFASGDLHADSPISYLGVQLAPAGDERLVGGEDTWDEHDVGTELNAQGGRRIRQVEAIRKQLFKEGRDDLAAKIPEFFFVPPYAMHSLADAQEYRKAFPDLDWDVLRDMQYSISRATFQGMGNPNVGYAIDLRRGEKNVHIPNHRAVDLNFLSDARKQGRTIGALVGEHYERMVDRWKNPSEIDFSPTSG